MSTTSKSVEAWRPHLAAMTTTEKLDLMELIWEDLTAKPEEFVSPDWHREVLESRRKEIENGTAVFQDWEDVKRELNEEG
jgi:hypothetical protein